MITKKDEINIIFNVVCNYYNIEQSELLSNSKTFDYKIPRFAAVYIIIEKVTNNIGYISEVILNRKNRTAAKEIYNNAIKKMEEDKNFKREVLELMGNII